MVRVALLGFGVICTGVRYVADQSLKFGRRDDFCGATVTTEGRLRVRFSLLGVDVNGNVVLRCYLSDPTKFGSYPELKPNSITLSGSKLVRSRFEAGRR